MINLSLLLMTSYGPSYGRVWLGFTLSFLRKTYLHVAMSVGINGFSRRCQDVCVGIIRFIMFFRSATNSVVGCVFDCIMRSEGKVKLVLVLSVRVRGVRKE